VNRRRVLAACIAVGTLALAASLAGLALLAPGAHAAVATTKHNLSASGPGTYRATSESEICVFCHAPHNTLPSSQLWNRRLPTSTYTPYTSSTRKSIAGQPNGASLLCLSCHDGTIALGEVLNRATPITMTGGALSGNALLGTNLSDDHPVSFTYDAALRATRGELADPATLVKPNKVQLDATGRMQCTSCHDPHDDANGKFLVMANTASALCVACHQKNYWSGTDHRTSTRTWNGSGTNPWTHTAGTTVAANACENCHRPHSAGGAKELLNYASEEANCYSCHNGNVAGKNIQAEFNKASAHDVGNYTGTHAPNEADPVAMSHVECVDCHNPHAAYATPLPTLGGSTVPVLPGSMAGVPGISIGGTPVNPAGYEYEVCFRCHGSSNPVTSRTARQLVQNDTRLEFQSANPSFHPVASVGRSTTVPSLLSPWTTSSRVKCSDCHNNNAGPYSAGTGTTPSGTNPNGPHGSTYPLLLERQYNVADPSTESATAYALCYKCHNRNVYANESTSKNTPGSFPYHFKHIVDKNTSCNVCHEPHGVSSTQGNLTNNSRLINFQTTVVSPSNGVLRFTKTTNGGSCQLVCHGANHNPWSYP
jgi:predicted CXXCH cytochrome family protein